MDEPPIINCHTHVFIVDDVPPKLARTISPAWLAWMIDTRLIAGLFGRYTRLNQSFKAVLSTNCGHTDFMLSGWH